METSLNDMSETNELNEMNLGALKSLLNQAFHLEDTREGVKWKRV